MTFNNRFIDHLTKPYSCAINKDNHNWLASSWSPFPCLTLKGPSSHKGQKKGTWFLAREAQTASLLVSAPNSQGQLAINDPPASRTASALPSPGQVSPERREFPEREQSQRTWILPLMSLHTT